MTMPAVDGQQQLTSAYHCEQKIIMSQYEQPMFEQLFMATY